MYLKKYLAISIYFFVFIVIANLILIRIFISSPSLEAYFLNSLKNKYSIIFFGDSVLRANHIEEDNKSSIPDIMKKNIAKSILEIQGTAYNTITYNYFAKTFNLYNNKTDIIIIPINLRSFSSSWLNVPEFQFEQECSFLSILIFKPDIKCTINHIKNLNPKIISQKHESFLNETISASGFLDKTTRRFFKSVGCVIEGKDLTCEDKNHFAQVIDYLQHGIDIFTALKIMKLNYHYGEIISDNNKALLALENMLLLLDKLDKKVLLYVTPHNFDAVSKYSGKQMTNIMEKNIKKISSRINSNNFTFLDLSKLLSEKNFEPDCACEHIDYEGKVKLVNALIKNIKKRKHNE